MVNYLIRRLLLMFPTLIGVTAVVFFVMALAPGDPAALLMEPGGELDAEQARAMEEYFRERYNLDQPVGMQYLSWLNQISPVGLQRGEARSDLLGYGYVWEGEVDGETRYRAVGFKPPDLGFSFVRGRAVIDLIADALPITILLNILATPVVYIVAILSGIWAARHRGKLFDQASGTFYLALWSVPVIWAGVLLIGVFASEDYVRWFPAGGLSSTQAGRMAFLPTGGALAQALGFALYVLLWVGLVGSSLIGVITALWLVTRGLGARRRAQRRGAGPPGVGLRLGATVVAVSAGLALVSAGVLYAGALPERMPGLERGWLVDRLWHLVLPVLCLSYAGFAFLSKLARGAVLENLTSDFARTARAKGLDDRTVLFRHVFRNSLLPMITVFVAIFPSLLSGSVIVEQIFSINGMGRLAVQSVFQQDREVVMAVALIGGLLGLLAILAQDVLYAIADPRVSYD